MVTNTMNEYQDAVQQLQNALTNYELSWEDVGFEMSAGPVSSSPLLMNLDTNDIVHETNSVVNQSNQMMVKRSHGKRCLSCLGLTA